jgi:hypothetical protein
MDARRAAAAGAIATAVTTALWLVEPSIGLPRIAVGQLLSTLMTVFVARMPVGAAGGWAIHLCVGIALAMIYAWLFVGRLPGSPIVRGATYGAMVFVVAQLLFMPLVGAGVFSNGDLELLTGSLFGHLLYGAVMGWIYGLSPMSSPRPPQAANHT